MVVLRAVRRYSSHCAVGALCCAVGLEKQYFQNRRIAIRRFQYQFSQSCSCIGESLCGREQNQSLCSFYSVPCGLLGICHPQFRSNPGTSEASPLYPKRERPSKARPRTQVWAAGCSTHCATFMKFCAVGNEYSESKSQ